MVGEWEVMTNHMRIRQGVFPGRIFAGMLQKFFGGVVFAAQEQQ